MIITPVTYLWIATVPLLIWPVAAMASLMSLSSPHSGSFTLLLLAARVFQISSLVYPVVFAASLFGYRVVHRRANPRLARIAAIVPFYFGCFILTTFLLWMALAGC